MLTGPTREKRTRYHRDDNDTSNVYFLPSSILWFYDVTFTSWGRSWKIEKWASEAFLSGIKNGTESVFLCHQKKHMAQRNTDTNLGLINGSFIKSDAGSVHFFLE